MTSTTDLQATFIVLGASGDIGSQVARQLRARGHRVLLASRSSDALAALALELQAEKYELGRLGEPAEVAALITWLLEPANSWVTCEVFAIDGGLAHVRLNPPSTMSSPK